MCRLVFVVGLLAGCDVERGYDPFPLRVDRSGGALISAADVGDGPIPVAIDILAPVTVMAMTDGGDAPRRLLLDLVLHGRRGDGSLPRVEFIDVPVIDLAPCAAPPCQVGPVGATREIAGVVGADVLGARAMRIDFPAGEIAFFPDIAGSSGERARLCEAVMGSPYGGGGTLLVAGTEVTYPGRRTALGACLAAGPAATTAETGTDALFVLSTGVGQSVMTRSAWDRLAVATGLPAFADLPPGQVILPSGPLGARLGTVPHLALVGDLGADSSGRGPCRELQVSRLMAEPAGCDRADVERCPCADGDLRCPAAAAVELERPLEVAVIDDAEPLLQSLRDELRPALAEIDGILGADALAALRLDLDYPNSRLMIRCLDAAACTAHPAVPNQSFLDDVATCREPDAAPDAGATP